MFVRRDVLFRVMSLVSLMNWLNIASHVFCRPLVFIADVHVRVPGGGGEFILVDDDNLH
jgi:hypothetical protein